MRPQALLLAAVLALPSLALAADEPAKPGAGHAYDPTVAPASPDAARSMAAFRPAKGLKIDLFAAEPLLANPVAFAFDEKGRAYVVETFRLHHGVTDNRGHMNWLDNDVANRTVEQRVAMYRKYLGKDAESYGTEHDRIRLVEDRDGDGKADHATIFADGFHDLADGLAAGVLARKGDVYFTCIPDLYKLRDTNGDGKADVKTSLHHGYGVHVAFLGHDLHGLILGPDGKLYFSVGDRGLNIKTPDGRTLFAPDTGSVLRCDPDGSALEIFATGLRNPQELAFDDHGNLFSVDNNSDSGDKARLVHLVEGSDSGWRMGYQYLESPVSRGPWNAEKLWYPHFPGQAAYILPPLANISDGPSGLTYDPGVSLLPDRYRRHFFLADFRGGSGNSGVRAFTVKPHGASFQLDQSEQFLWSVLATDVDFGPDGGLYVSDWVEGWNLTGKGRIYRVTDPASPHADAAREVKTLLADGFDQRPPAELARLLAHPDRRVRQEAQFALASLGAPSIETLETVASDPAHPLARLHAVWGLGQVGAKAPAALQAVVPLLKDQDPEVRAQAARTLGDARSAASAEGLIALLRDDSPRVRSIAALALGKLGRKDALQPLLTLLRDNADRDPALRHAGVMGLVGLADLPALLSAASDPAPAVRMGVLLALRRLEKPEVSRFLDDADPALVAEAARAIYDVPIDPAMPALAALADRQGLVEPALRRAVNAAARLGQAPPLARLASRTDVPEPVRVEAVEALADWPKPPGRDRVTGLWRPADPRPSKEAADALVPVYAALLNGPSEPLRLAALRAAGPLPMPVSVAGPLLHAVVSNPSRPAATRAEALKGLERLGDPGLATAVSLAVKDRNTAVRVAGQGLLARLDPAQALPVLTAVLDSGPVREKQGAFATLAAMPAGVSDPLLAAWLDRLAAGKAAPEVALDLLEAARRRKSPDVASRLKALDASLPKDDPLAPYREALVGGDAARGEKVFSEKAELACVRCHKVKGQGGEVGPELTGVGARQDRRYLLESIVTPNKQIAKGFETLLVATDDGQVHGGILKEETKDALKLINPDGKMLTIPKSTVEGRKSGSSAMPDDIIKQLAKPELRDLIEYLSTLK